MGSYLQKPKKQIKKAENTRRRHTKIKKRIAQLREQDVDALLEKQKHKDEEIYLDDDYFNEIIMPNATEDNNDDSLFVSSKTNASSSDNNIDNDSNSGVGINDNTDSDANSGGAPLINSTSKGGETKAKLKILNRQKLKIEGE